jgi:hypothetical protein
MEDMTQRSDEVMALRYLENTMVSPETKDFELVIKKHPDEIREVLDGLERQEMVVSIETDWRFGTNWALTNLGKAVYLLLKESGAKNLELLKDEIDLVRREICEGKVVGSR